MARWTRFVVRNRRKVLLAWLVVFLLGATASASLGDLLTNRVAVPGSDAQKGADLIEERMNDKAAGTFTLVFQATRGSSKDPAFTHSEQAAAARAAAVVKDAK